MKKFFGILLVMVAVAVGIVSLAAAYPAKLESFPSGFRIRAEQNIRFFVDYQQKQIIVPEAQLPEGTSVPSDAKLELRADGFILTLSYPFSVTLNPSGKLLTILKDEPNAVPSDVRIPVFYEMHNAQASQVAAILTRLYPGLKVEVDERQRSIIVLLSPADREVVDQVIKRLDAPRLQVMFEAEIVEINRKISQQLGIDYSRLFNLNFKFNEGTPPNGVLGFAPFQRSPLSLEVGINLLKSNGVARTLTRPRIAVLDGLEARINATQTQPIRTVGSGGQVTVSNITTGISLRLVPKVAPDKTIESQLSIAVSSPTGISSEGLPTYSTREASTTVRVKNAESIVIGGLIESRRSTSSSGIPGLMDIPILGELFRTTFTEESDTDLLIVVTPYVVNNVLLPETPPAPETPQEPPSQP